MYAEALSLLSFLSVELQTEHLHPIIGTPDDVPVPKNVIVFFIFQLFCLLLFQLFWRLTFPQLLQLLLLFWPQFSWLLQHLFLPCLPPLFFCQRPFVLEFFCGTILQKS